MPHERKRVEIVEYPLEDRDKLLQRIEACGDNIHSPYCWYKDDVRRLLILLDFQYTENQTLHSLIERMEV